MQALYFLPFVLFSASPWCSSALALILGLGLGVGLQWQLPDLMRRHSKFVMQAAIVALGFSMKPSAVAAAGTTGIGVTLTSLIAIMACGLILSKFLKLQGTTGILISAGTGICGGSAIASMSPVLESKPEETAVAMATVFCLNALALVIFPPMGHALGLTPSQFGWLAAIAIHDTSSVVGAATQFDPGSVAIAVTTKLTRALWIIPMLVVTTIVLRIKHRGQESKRKLMIPWFIFVFVGAVILHGLLPDMPQAYNASDLIGRGALKVAIFAAGAQLTRATIAKVGLRSMGLGVILWFMTTVGMILWVTNTSTPGI